MSEKHRLRMSRAGTILNLTAKKQESALGKALKIATARLLEEFGLELVHKKAWSIVEIVARLREDFPDVEFYEPSGNPTMMPDGGILSITNSAKEEFPVVISEVKNQGTNDLRAAEGKARQAMGNAIERLGKNVIGIRTAMLTEGIVPFVCFGYGVDFCEGSYIRDRVATIAMFGPLNQVHLVNAGPQERFSRGSFFFREERWTEEEMADVLFEVGSRSIHYYFAKYGKSAFLKSSV
jgi:type II restriction enzyme